MPEMTSKQGEPCRTTYMTSNLYNDRTMAYQDSSKQYACLRVEMDIPEKPFLPLLLPKVVGSSPAGCT